MRVGLDLPSGTDYGVFKEILTHARVFRAILDELAVYTEYDEYATRLSVWSDVSGNCEIFDYYAIIDGLDRTCFLYLHTDGFWRNHPEELK